MNEKRDIPTKVIKTLEEMEIKDIDKEKKIIWHTITKETKDRLGDIVRIDGLDLKNFKKKPSVFFAHNYTSIDPLPIIGKNVGFKYEGKKLIAGTKFLIDSDLSKKLSDLIGDLWILNVMKLMGWSIGFKPKPGKTEDITEDGKWTGYDFKESELLEYSNVTIPAHQDAINDAYNEGMISKHFIDVEVPTIGEIAEEKIDETKALDTEAEEDEIYDQESQEIEDFDDLEEVDSEFIEKPYPNEHSARLKETNLFDPKTFRRKNDGTIYGKIKVPATIAVIWAKLKEHNKPSDNPIPQALRFPTKNWTVATAKAWLKDNKIKYIKFEPASSAKEDKQDLSSDQIKKIHKILSNMEQIKELKLQIFKNQKEKTNHG